MADSAPPISAVAAAGNASASDRPAGPCFGGRPIEMELAQDQPAVVYPVNRTRPAGERSRCGVRTWSHQLEAGAAGGAACDKDSPWADGLQLQGRHNSAQHGRQGRFAGLKPTI
jgi:hypothetical protein